jgi:maltose O-acetyltransferase
MMKRMGDLLSLIPTRLGVKLRSHYYKNKCAFFGNNVSLEMLTVMYSPDYIKIGNNTFINRGCCIDATSGEIIIGDNVMIGCDCVFSCSNHKLLRSDIPMTLQGFDSGKIHINNDVWIGAKAVILKDVMIGEGSVIGAGSVVTKNIPAYSIAVGNPARVIKKR